MTNPIIHTLGNQTYCRVYDGGAILLSDRHGKLFLDPEQARRLTAILNKETTS